MFYYFSRLAVIDENYALEVLHIKGDNKESLFKCNNIWTVMWSSNSVDSFACLEKMKLNLYKDNQLNVKKIFSSNRKHDNNQLHNTLS